MSEGLVIIPTYNEIENIEKIIRAVLALSISFDVLVVDDGSPDGTGAKVTQLMKEFPSRLYLENRIGKSGLGTAYIHGFKWALKRDYQYVFEMDADFSHNPKDLVRLLESSKNENADVVIGSRYISGVNVVNWPLSRVLMSYFASIYVKMVMGFKVHDATSGFICYRRRVLEGVNLEKVRFVGYAFQIEMKYRASVKGFKLLEIPIIFTDRTKGESKMSNAIISEAVFGVITLRLKKFFRKL
ncbi:MAG: polyprenol monophosphomannose synthase [Flavobacteriales bacterium]|nr:polyprenol monophosphomannose synthase [Flavobacteriales bacterium]